MIRGYAVHNCSISQQSVVMPVQHSTVTEPPRSFLFFYFILFLFLFFYYCDE